MTKKEFDEMLRLHEMWLNGEEGGKRANMQDADMRGANMQGADMRGADMQDANMWRADMRHANMRGANMQDADMRGANMQDADMQGADMRGADMRHANMRGANMRGANMQDADMRGANMRGANMQDADMRGANIDYSAWPLWCGLLKAYVDDRIAIQLLYHTLSVVQHSPYVSEDVKAKLLTPEIVSLANRFHRVLEGGEIKEWEEGTK